MAGSPNIPFPLLGFQPVGEPDYVVVLMLASREEADKGCAFYVPAVFGGLEGQRFSFSGAIYAKPDGAKFSPINCLKYANLFSKHLYYQYQDKSMRMSPTK